MSEIVGIIKDSTWLVITFSGVIVSVVGIFWRVRLKMNELRNQFKLSIAKLEEQTKLKFAEITENTKLQFARIDGEINTMKALKDELASKVDDVVMSTKETNKQLVKTNTLLAEQIAYQKGKEHRSSQGQTD